MYPQVQMKNLLIRLALAIMLGIATITIIPFTVEAKDKISTKAIEEMIAGAKTPADHQAIANYYKTEASKALAKAQEHEQMGASYAAWNKQAGSEGV